jgi:integrase
VARNSAEGSRGGVYARHKKACASRSGDECSCAVSWEARVWDKARDKQMTKSFKAKREAIAWRQDTQAALRRGTATSSGATVNDVWAGIVTSFEAGIPPSSNVDVPKPSTMRNSEINWRLRVGPSFGPLKVAEIRRSHVEEFILQMRSDGLSDATCSNTMTVLRTVIRVAMAKEMITVDPTAGVVIQRSDTEEKTAREPDEIDQRLALLTGWKHTLFIVLADTGLRVGEALALEWSSVDFGSNEIIVRSNWDPKTKNFLTPKTKKGWRSVPMTKRVSEELKSYMKTRKPPVEGLVFQCVGTVGRPREYNNIVASTNKCWADAGLDRMTPHDFRHSFITHLVRACPDLRAAADIAGHKDIAFMIERYVHSNPGSRADAIKAYEAWLGA